MATIQVNPGICGLKTKLVVTADDDQMVQVAIDSECPHIQAMEAELQELDGYSECLGRFTGSTVYAAADRHCRHVACPVPSAIIKGMEVACGLALPKDVEIRVEK